MENNNKHTTKNMTPVYRILTADQTHSHLVLSKLISAPNSQKKSSYNAIVLNSHRSTFEKLRRMDVKQLEKLAKLSTGVVTYLVDLNALSERIKSMDKANKRYEEELEKAKWLIGRKSSNQLVLTICTHLSSEDIKRIRNELNVHVVKGRLKMPDIDTRIKILGSVLKCMMQNSNITVIDIEKA